MQRSVASRGLTPCDVMWRDMFEITWCNVTRFCRRVL